MSNDELPVWVWNLLADLVDEDAIHPPLFTFHGAPYEWCPLVALNRIPDEILRVAEHIAKYRREVNR